MNLNWLLLLGVFGTLDQCLAANILFLIPMPARSHYNLGDRLMRELVNKGHKVTVIGAFPMSNPPKNLTEIVVPFSEQQFNKMVNVEDGKEGKFGMRNMTPLAFLFFSKIGSIVFESTMNSTQVQDFMNTNEKFDVVIGECFLVEGLLAGFSQKFKAPMIGIATFMPNTWSNSMVGNPASSSYVPEPILSYTHKMTFIQRCINFLYSSLALFAHHYSHIPAQDKLMRKYFDSNLPPLRDLVANTSLVLVNHHYSLAFPRPYLPNMVEVGSYHIKPPQPLPKDLQKFMDEATDGVILFSMGSNLASSEFPDEKVQGILRTFSRLKQRVLWKFEKENTLNLPKNVRISKWLPQSDILAHPNLKLFITHGGLLSITEAVYRGVPLVAIPIFGDQPVNVNFVLEHGIGVKLEYDDIKEEPLAKAINEVLSNPKYEKNMKKRSVLLRDVPISQLETAIYWIEYVIRYKGAPHLRSGAQDLAWYQLYLLDVFGFLGLILFSFLFLFCKFVKCCRSFFFGKKTKQTQSKKKDQ